MQALQETKRRLQDNERELNFVRIPKKEMASTPTRLQAQVKVAKATVEGSKSILEAQSRAQSPSGKGAKGAVVLSGTCNQYLNLGAKMFASVSNICRPEKSELKAFNETLKLCRERRSGVVAAIRV